MGKEGVQFGMYCFGVAEGHADGDGSLTVDGWDQSSG